MQQIDGYFDFMSRETVRRFKQMREHGGSEFARNNQQLIFGPWEHSDGDKTEAGDLDYGEVAVVDHVGENIVWFDRYLRMEENERPAIPAVRYFMIGENKWREANDWPPEEAEMTSFYLHSNGNANTRKGDGRIESTPPSGSAHSSDTFQADPDDPVPSVPAKGKEYASSYGPLDQQAVHDRDDVLIYRSEPLDSPLVFAGPIAARIFMSTDTPDADAVVRLIDLHPDGFAPALATGIQRASLSKSVTEQTPIEPGKTYEFEVDMGHVAARIEPGHRLCIQVCGSNFPIWDRNTNTGEGPFGETARVATQNIWHSADKPSRLLLPILAE